MGSTRPPPPTAPSVRQVPAAGPVPTALPKPGRVPTSRVDVPAEVPGRRRRAGKVRHATGSATVGSFWLSLLILQMQPALVLRASLIPALSNRSRARRSGAAEPPAAQRELRSCKEHKAELQNQTGGILHPPGPCQAAIPPPPPRQSVWHVQQPQQHPAPPQSATSPCALPNAASSSSRGLQPLLGVTSAPLPAVRLLLPPPVPFWDGAVPRAPWGTSGFPKGRAPAQEHLTHATPQLGATS